MLTYSQTQADPQYQLIPELIVDGLNRYIQHGITPGSCMQAMIRDDLRETIARADNETFLAMKQIVKYIANQGPSGCFGSQLAYTTWAIMPDDERTEIVKLFEFR